jgi:TolB-like protein/tetratricopeptide (TPR) repeat protein
MEPCRFGRFEVRPAERRLLVDGEPAALGARAFDLLLALLDRCDRVVGTVELVELIWPGVVVEENNLRQQVAALRRVLGANAIATVPGRGYRFGLSPEAPHSRDLEAALETHTSPRLSIAVLPFANLSGDTSQEYFSDAVTQDIITGLSKHRWLTVVARNTVFSYKNMAVDVRELARELGVGYVVDGSVQRAGLRLRITAELIDADTGSACWSERYDRDLADVFAVRDEITDTIVGRLEPEIGCAERRKVVRRSPTRLEAWDCYHLGVAHFYRFTAPDNREALRLLQRSRDMDPSFGEAHAWWAYATVLSMVYWEAQPQPVALDEALRATQQALRLDDQDALFYAIKGRVQLARREYESARKENEIAIELNPTLAVARCGLGDTLAYQGHYVDAMAQFRKALALSPRDPQRWAFLSYGSLALIFKGDFALSLRWAEEALEIPNCQYWATAHRAVALAYVSRQAEAHDTVARLLVLEPCFSIEFAARKLFFIRDPSQIQRYLHGLKSAGVPAKV